MSRDTIYRAPGPATDFAFGPQVAGVFDDMVERSVPGYLMMQEYLVRTIDTLPNPPATVLDIGCATGTSMALLADRYPGIHLIGYDDSEPMLAKAEQRLAQLPSASFDLRADDVCEVREFPAADVVLLNQTTGCAPRRAGLTTRWHSNGLRVSARSYPRPARRCSARISSRARPEIRPVAGSWRRVKAAAGCRSTKLASSPKVYRELSGP